ncbi:serine/threonine-protein kinase PLK4 [Octodon degus]|uniref:Serine/threonine-protein kinase PLK4 n=1 Tax=Octodon degus TaxID=10160 RepID=A0A6P3EZ49_OCTDE|nr:serine/threonine-protein kinase PLK4 [Octodon degus]
MLSSSDTCYIEDFKVGNLLGKGSLAGVYRAESIHTGLEVAIKMLYNYFEDNNYVYLVLEMCHNGEKNRYLKNRMKPFSENEARHFMHQIITGLLYLHSHGILHRDLTLSNLLLTHNMNIKIADFGLATQLQMPHEKHYTLCGTPNYISPEILRRAHSSDRSSSSNSQSRTKPCMMDRCHSAEMLSRSKRSGVEENEDKDNIFHFFKEKTSNGSGSCERLDHHRALSNHLCPGKTPFSDQIPQTEMVQQWFGNLQLNAHLRETTEHNSITPNGDFQGHPDVQSTTTNAWAGTRARKGSDASENTHFVKQPNVSILDSEEVCVELLKEHASQEYVKEVLQIASDGKMITVYYPDDGRGFPLTDQPPSPASSITRYSFDSLPEKYWKKYQYASRFVQLVRSKSPKITYFTRYAKCILMENSPDANFEVWFYDGTKIHKTEDFIQVIEKTGKSCNLKHENEVNGLKEEIKIYMDHANEGHRICLALEFIISEEEKKSRSAPFFPIIVGRKPGCINSPKALPSVDSNCSIKDEPSLNKLVLSSAVSPAQAPVLNPSVVTPEGLGHTAIASGTNIPSSNPKDCLPKSAQLLKSIFVKNVGWATQLTSGAVWAQFNDGSQLVVQAGVSSISYTSPNGQTTRYGEHDKLPEYIKQKLQCLRSMLAMFSNPTPTFL